MAQKTYYGLTCSQIMRRAWQLAKLNRGTVNSTGRENLGKWISYAWAEAQRGETENWDFLSAEHEAHAVERQLTAVSMGHGSDRFSGVNFSLRSLLTDRLASLRASIGCAA
jgi:hypothetical protein